MCGFSGFLGNIANYSDDDSLTKLLKNMASTLRHRGPDDSGFWFDKTGCIGINHSRLAILDLSSAGSQPMTSDSGRYVIAFNGEIYNHIFLREKLNKHGVQVKWRGHSDTETLLACFDTWGIEATVKQCVGMFSFAAWCKDENILILGRDRLGEKPLYYGWQDRQGVRCFLFGSELKPLKLHPSFLGSINRDALCLMMRYGYIPAPHSIYTGIFKLQPGCLLSVSLLEPEPKIWPYWSAETTISNCIRNPFSGSQDQAIDSLEYLLTEAIKRQMISDAPIGAFLSGGIDSSTIVALMQAQSTVPIKTFSIGFNESKYDEGVYAKAVARHIGTEHVDLYVTPEQALSVISLMPSLYDEPFADSSQIPTYLLSQLANKVVKVSLSGDAGDELFCGYNRYELVSNLWRTLNKIPIPIRSLMGRFLVLIPPYWWDCMLRKIPVFKKYHNIGDKIHKGASVIASQSIDDLYLGLVSHWQNPEMIVVDGKEPNSNLILNKLNFIGLDDVQRMMALDTVQYLPDDILTKVDRAAMGASLETRMPFLDPEVFEFAWKLPLKYKLRDKKTKWILRQVLYRYVPSDLIDRPKMGFGVPIDSWLRGPLKAWAENLIDEKRLQREGYFCPKLVREKWSEHLSGRRNWQHLLWNVLMFQAWLESEEK
jgi:asparagine synthase (glutamine-hydrolysing)